MFHVVQDFQIQDESKRVILSFLVFRKAATCQKRKNFDEKRAQNANTAPLSVAVRSSNK
jgi:hypothetical protein